MIHEATETFNNISVVKDILNITEETYMKSAIFYNVIIFVCFNHNRQVMR